MQHSSHMIEQAVLKNISRVFDKNQLHGFRLSYYTLYTQINVCKIPSAKYFFLFSNHRFQKNLLSLSLCMKYATRNQLKLNSINTLTVNVD